MVATASMKSDSARISVSSRAISSVTVFVPEAAFPDAEDLAAFFGLEVFFADAVFFAADFVPEVFFVPADLELAFAFAAAVPAVLFFVDSGFAAELVFFLEVAGFVTVFLEDAVLFVADVFDAEVFFFSDFDAVVDCDFVPDDLETDFGFVALVFDALVVFAPEVPEVFFFSSEDFEAEFFFAVADFLELDFDAAVFFVAVFRVEVLVSVVFAILVLYHGFSKCSKHVVIWKNG